MPLNFYLDLALQLAMTTTTLWIQESQFMGRSVCSNVYGDLESLWISWCLYLIRVPSVWPYVSLLLHSKVKCLIQRERSTFFQDFALHANYRSTSHVRCLDHESCNFCDSRVQVNVNKWVNTRRPLHQPAAFPLPRAEPELPECQVNASLFPMIGKERQYAFTKSLLQLLRLVLESPRLQRTLSLSWVVIDCHRVRSTSYL